MGAIISTHIYQLTEKELFRLLRNSLIAGECFAEDNQAFEMEEVEEVTELDFDEYFNRLELSNYQID